MKRPIKKLFLLMFLIGLCSARAQTVVWSENFDDGNGNNRWYADQGVWQIGSPTIGPETNSAGYRTHSGPDCATTGLTANYPVGANSRLIRIQTFTVPATNQFPRLRFWQWYNFASDCQNDYGVVEIMAGTNAWKAVSPQYTGFCGDWTYASIDLSAYAGQTVQLAFHMVYANCGGYTDPGWYVDDIALETGTPVFNNPEGFEGGIGDWYAETGTWQVGAPTKAGGAPTNSLGYQAHSGSNCAVTVLNANYPAGANSRFISAAFVVPSADQFPRLRFWQWYGFASDCQNDYGVVEIRVGTNAWQAVSEHYAGYSDGWTEPSLDLSAYAGQTVQLALHMVYANCGGYTDPGWYVDDIAVETGTPVFNNPEGFEGGIGDWYAETGIWQVGTPTKAGGAPINSLGYQAHGGSNCAVTILNANYPAGANSRFISPAFVVPAATDYPRLRFWQWYSFASDCQNDYGVVEIRVGTNAWQGISPQYVGYSGGWTEPSMDLSAYAGQTVQLAFHMVYANCGGYTDPGWYVDDISVDTGMPVFNNPEGFEGGIGDWYAETGTWQVGTPTKAGGAPTNSLGYQTHSGSSCAVTVLNANYPAGANSRFISAAFVVPPAGQSPRLRFWQWYSFASDCQNDYGVVEIRVGTNAWQAVSEQYVGYSDGWTEPLVDLSAYAGQTVQLAFHMVYANCGGYTDPGWYVDDIAVETGTRVLNNPEGFEGGIGDWYAETGIWQVGTPAKAGGAPTNSLGYQAHGGSNCAVTILNANYPVNANSRLVSPVFVVPPLSSSPALRFWHWYSFASDCQNDYGVVEIKSGTNAWQTISPQYVGNSGSWTEPFVPLNSYAGQTVQLAFYMVYANCGGYTAPGWYVDDISFPAGALVPIPDFSIYPTTFWTYTPSAPGSGLSYSLSNAPAGMSVDPNAGTISWTPTTNQLGIYSNITFLVNQAGSPPQPLSSASFSVTVNAGVIPLQPPSIAITNLANGTNFLVPAIIPINVSASDPNAIGAITQVAFFNGLNQIGLVTNAPFNFVWTNSTLGAFVLTAVATDNYGLSSNSLPVSGTVSRRPLTVALTQPANGATFPVPNNVAVTATASDSNSNGVITQLSILAGTNVLGTATTSPLSVTWTSPPFGAYAMVAVASDNFGILTTSAPVNITVTVQQPLVAITNPVSGTQFAGGNNITLNATASDLNSGGSIARVAFYAGTSLLGVVSNSPYLFTWTNPPTASYTLTAVATDNYGASATSPPIPVIVNPATYTFSFNSATYSVNENGAAVTLTVVNHAALTGLVSYETVDGTAHGGNGVSGDYTASQGNLSFTGQASLTITIPIIDNFINGPSLQFQVQLFNPRTGSLAPPATATVTILRNDPGAATNVLIPPLSPTNRPVMNAQLTVFLPPSADGGQWRFPWEYAWRNDGDTASSLVPGDYPVQFRPVPGYMAVPLPSDPIVAYGQTTIVTNSYYPTPLVGSGALGSLTINITPSTLSGSGWQFFGETAWRPGGSTVANLLPDTYLVAFEPVAGYATPPSLAVLVSNGMSVTEFGNYTVAPAAPPGLVLPASLSTASILDYAHYPYGFSGQLQTDVGFGSGAAVTKTVVLTAAHMVFNDYTLSYVSNAFWSFQKQTGVFQPEPQAARGWYVLSGYASQRTNDLPPVGSLQPDQSSPQSRDLDVAALYFLTYSARTGFGGFISSDTAPNPYLTGVSNKTLVGYPVDGSTFGAVLTPGLMYATSPGPLAFFQTNDQVYASTNLFSYPGNSGGPLCVQYADGNYYPAAVYLGTLFNSGAPYASVVRAIDSNVVNLITFAFELGDSGTNNSGFGVNPISTIIPVGVTAQNPGYLILQLGPPSAVQAGAAWKFTNQAASYYLTANSSVQVVTTTNPLTVQFKPIPGWNLPTNRIVALFGGMVLTNLAAYTVTNPALTFDPVQGLGLSGTTNTTYQIQSNSSLTGTWVPFKTNTLTNFGFNLITNKPSPGFYRALWLTNSP